MAKDYTCDCGASFNSNEELMRHNQQVHPEKQGGRGLQEARPAASPNPNR